MRFRSVDSKPFWFDEAFSVEVARMDWRSFLHLIWWREANMSLYYVLLRAWLDFGQSPLFIRSLSVVISAATLPAIYWVGKLLYDRRVALLATALLAFNAYSVRYAQDTLFRLSDFLAARNGAGLEVAICDLKRSSIPRKSLRHHQCFGGLRTSLRNSTHCSSLDFCAYFPPP
jgi:hypothetical protein